MDRYMEYMLYKYNRDTTDRVDYISFVSLDGVVGVSRPSQGAHRRFIMDIVWSVREKVYGTPYTREILNEVVPPSGRSVNFPEVAFYDVYF